MADTTAVLVDQRHAERTLYPDLRIICNGLAATTGTRPPDLSPDGMFVNTPLGFSPGTTIQLRFDLICTGAVVEGRGKVRYWVPGVGVGVEFVDLAAPCRAAIERELAWKKLDRALTRPGAKKDPPASES